MPQRLPSLNALRVFEAAGRHLSFTQAALELHVTQSAISHQIKLLEEDLGTRLFQREGTKLLLTEDGEQLLPALSRLFAEMVAAVDAVRVSTRQRPLDILLRPYFAHEWLIPRLERFWQAHPDIDLHLVHSIQPPDFSNHQIDLAIQWTRQPSPEFESVLLLKGDLTPVCSPRLLEARGGSLHPAELREYPLLDEESPDNWDHWLALAGVAGLAPRKRISIDDTNVRLQAAIDGQGFMLTCPSLLRYEVVRGRLLVAPFDIMLPSYSYYLVYPKNTPLKPQLRRFIDWILAEARRS